MLSKAKHLYRIHWIANPNVAGEMLQCVKNDAIIASTYEAPTPYAARKPVAWRIVRSLPVAASA